MIDYFESPALDCFELAPTDYVAETLTDDRRLAAALLSTYLPKKYSDTIEWTQISVEPPGDPIDPKTSENRALMFSAPRVVDDATRWFNVVVARNTKHLMFAAPNIFSNSLEQTLKLYAKRRVGADCEAFWPLPTLFFCDAKPLERAPKMTDVFGSPLSRAGDDDPLVPNVKYLTIDLAALDLEVADPALRLFLDVLRRGENQTLVEDFRANKLLWESTDFDWNAYPNERFLSLVYKTLCYVSYLARVNDKPLRERSLRQIAVATRNERVKKEIEYFVYKVFE